MDKAAADRVDVERPLPEHAWNSAELQKRVREQAELLAELERKRQLTDQQTRETQRLHAQVQARFTLAETQRATAERLSLEAGARLQELRLQHQMVVASTLWRVSAPLRRLGDGMPGWLRRSVRLLAGSRRALSALPVVPTLPNAAPPGTALDEKGGKPRPSDLLRAIDPSWIEPIERQEFRRLREVRPSGRIAVVAHLYYPDLWPEIATAIGHIAEPFDLFVTLVAGAADDLEPQIRQRWPSAYVLTVDNHGRDILPLIAIIQTGVLARYDLVCKLHTKRSFWHEDGDAWRRSLIRGVLGNPGAVDEILAAFRADPELGMVVADGQMYAGRELWVGNERHLLRLFANFGMDQTEFDKSFAGGSMYWIRAELLQRLADLNLRFDDFEAEPLGKDGSLAHAVERLVSLICYHAGTSIKEAGAIVPLRRSLAALPSDARA